MKIQKIVNCHYIRTYVLDLSPKDCRLLTEEIQDYINEYYKWKVDLSDTPLTLMQIADIMDKNDDRLPEYLTAKHGDCGPNELPYRSITIADIVRDRVDTLLWRCTPTAEYKDSIYNYNEVIY